MWICLSYVDIILSEKPIPRLMFKKNIITIFALFILPLQLFSQNNKNDNPVSISFQVGYIFPQSTDGPYGSLKGGPELKPSVYKKVSNSITALFEFVYSEHKYKTDENNLLINRYINIGIRFYPRTQERLYLKPSIGYSLDENYSSFPSINFGIGNDFKISGNIDIVGETEIFFRLYNQDIISFSFSGGIKFNFF
jgi:hypothetical protein